MTFDSVLDIVRKRVGVKFSPHKNYYNYFSTMLKESSQNVYGPKEISRQYNEFREKNPSTWKQKIDSAMHLVQADATRTTLAQRKNDFKKLTKGIRDSVCCLTLSACGLCLQLPAAGRICIHLWVPVYLGFRRE